MQKKDLWIGLISILFLLTSVFFCNPQSINPILRNNVLILGNLTPGENNLYQLKEWQFFPNRFFIGEPIAKRKISEMFSLFSISDFSNLKSSYSQGTIRTRILFKEEFKKKSNLYLYLENSQSPYSLYINGKFISHCGSLDENKIPSYCFENKWIPLNSTDSVQIEILFSMPFYQLDKVPLRIWIGQREEIEQRLSVQQIFTLLFLVFSGNIFLYSIFKFRRSRYFIFTLTSGSSIFFLFTFRLEYSKSLFSPDSENTLGYIFPGIKLLLFFTNYYILYLLIRFFRTKKLRASFHFVSLPIYMIIYYFFETSSLGFFQNLYFCLNIIMSYTLIYLFSDWNRNSINVLNEYALNYKIELENIKQHLKEYKKTFEQKILDRSFHLVTYMERLEIQTEEMEKLNELIVNLLEGSDINKVLDGIFLHILTYYRADIAFLYFIDPKTNEFYPYRGMTKNIPKEIQENMLNTRMPVSREAGLSYLVYKRKRILYKENSKTKYLKKPEIATEMQLPELLSQLYIPILIRNEFQGIFFLSSFNHPMNLNKEKLKYISMFSNQLAIALQKDIILKEMDEAKKRAEMERENAERARKEAESAKLEIEAINSLTKSINENLEIKFIMDKIMTFVETHYGIKYYSLYTVNHKKDKVKMLDAKFPESISSSEKRRKMEISIPIQENQGAHAFIYQTGKMVYFKTLQMDKSCEEEKKALENLNIASMVGIPLKVKGEIIGILSFFSPEKIKLSRNHLRTISNLGEQVAGVINNSNLHKQVQAEKDKSENLLLSILPPKVATELKNTGKVSPVIYDSATILFTDFVGFTSIAEELRPEQLLIELDGFFTFFDFICEKFNLEKLKTIGDSYMCAGGLPITNFTHPIDACLTALEFRDFAFRMKELAASSKGKMISWELRIGLHTGPAIGGVVGTTKFAYDVWGDSVNTASRIESSGLPGKINISEATYELVKHFFECEYRGKVNAKNKGSIDMYFLNKLNPMFAKGEDENLPNELFYEYYEKIKSGELKLAELNSVFGKNQHILA